MKSSMIDVNMLSLFCVVGTYSEDSLKREKQKLLASTVEEGTDAKCKPASVPVYYNLIWHVVI